MLLKSLGSPSVTGSRSTCSAWYHLNGFSSSSHSIWIVRTQDSGLWSPNLLPRGSVSPRVRSGWSWARDEESSAMGRNVMVFIPVCSLLVNGKIFTSAYLKILALLIVFNFTLGTAAVVCGSGKGGAGEMTLTQPNPFSRRECSHE